jgi:hypothetical protein
MTVYGYARVSSESQSLITVNLDGAQLTLEPGQGVISHGVDRDLTVGR